MSSGSESDDEYVPGEPEVVSEEDSADEETETQYEQELDIKTKKRKAKQENKVKKKAKTRKNVKEPIAEVVKDEDIVEEKPDPEEEKKREDDLWAKFLEGTDSKPKNTSKAPETTSNLKDRKDITPSICSDSKNHEKSKSNDNDIERERRIFEFAGETLVVENNIIKERIKADNFAAAKTSEVSSVKPRTSGGGLSSVLEQLNKKNKLSTLEKSKLDWETYKKEEDIEEEIKNYNKGKNGYLERKDFLERADIRQFEIERDLRTSRRSSRLS